MMVPACSVTVISMLLVLQNPRTKSVNSDKMRQISNDKEDGKAFRWMSVSIDEFS